MDVHWKLVTYDWYFQNLNKYGSLPDVEIELEEDKLEQM